MLTATNRKRQCGAQAVEFALILPFFLALMLLIIDMGFLVFNKAVITNASREAARAGTVLTAAPWSAAAVAAVACNYARTSLISSNSGSHAADCSGSADPVIAVTPQVQPNFGDPVSVSVTYPYQGFLKSLMGTTIESLWSLNATTPMIHE